MNFWAYTRSWAIEELEEEIKKLGELDNMKLILSWDETMTQPPDGFARSIVLSSNEEVILAANKKDEVVCPEQYSLVSGCADCGICINNLSGAVYFVAH